MEAQITLPTSGRKGDNKDIEGDLMNASIQQKLANKLGELLDEKLDKHIELMRQKKL